MDRVYCLKEEEYKKIQATLLFAKKLGLVKEADLSSLDKRRVDLNRRNQEKLDKGETVYGVISYSPPAYLQYELTRFKLDFIEEIDRIKERYSYREISEEEKRSFYSENMDLFTRYFGDAFSYEEVELIIEKRLREAEYDKNVKDILCKLP